MYTVIMTGKQKKMMMVRLRIFVAMGIIGAVANVGISFITAKMLGQDYGWQNVLEDSISGALCAIPAISMISNSEKYLKRAGQIIMVGKGCMVSYFRLFKGIFIKEDSIIYESKHGWKHLILVG